MMAEGHRRQAARSVIDHTEHGGRLVAGGDTVNDIGMKKTVALREIRQNQPHEWRRHDFGKTDGSLPRGFAGITRHSPA